MTKKQGKRPLSGWDPVAEWYDGWVGPAGSDHHQKLAIPAVMDLLALIKGETVLDIGAGQGVLAPHIAEAGGRSTGVEISPKLLEIARGRHPGRFLRGDARALPSIKGLDAASFDAAVFLLSIEDIDPLAAAVDSAAWALKPDGRLVILMRHPCFRVPRQSGWGFDEGRSLQYRRVDSYLSPLRVPMKQFGGDRRGVTISFHRPLSQYFDALTRAGLVIDALREITTYKEGANKAERRANDEFPVFMALRARKLNLVSPG